ncbi:MAG: hypothetical protein JNL60_03745 [Bacteroidia bacterium]|nr:hypothetical protein [Bacteroidia bacterium]
MKKTIAVLLILACIFSCQKKKKSEEEPTPTTTGTTPIDDPMITVKINDTTYTCPSLSCVSAYKSGSIRGLAIGDQSAKKNLFRFTFLSMPTAGTYPLDGSGTVSLQYVNNNTYYNVKAGTLNITSVDTTDRGVIDHFRATFSAKTDTTLAPQYPVFKITEGIIKIK